MPDTHRTKTPWHLWIIGVVALLWSAIGAFDYVMTQTKNESYMGMFTSEQLEFFLRFSFLVGSILGYCRLGRCTWLNITASTKKFSSLVVLGFFG